jgi:hypothetical protein
VIRLTLNRAGSPRRPFCDGISRRNFLSIGSLGLAGLTLPNLLRAEQARPSATGQRSVIMVYLSGGLSHQDTFDLKPNAPAEIRGEFKPIASNVPGLQVGELLPKLSQTMHRIALLRSLVGFRDEHTSFQNLTGFPMDEAIRDRVPNVGCVVTKALGSTDPELPAYTDLFPIMQHRPYNIPGSGYLGRGADGVKVEEQTLALMKLRELAPGQLDDRRSLLHSIDQFRRDYDARAVAGMETSYERAFNILTSSKMLEALDITQEPIGLRDRYGHGSKQHIGDGAPMWNDQLLAARRLVEAGVRFVSVAYGFWDTHGNNFGHLRQHLPLFDAGISALINDIYDRGLDREVMVIVWGEFGRTPKINANGGRDHWAPVNSALIAGGGCKVGQVIGSTDSLGAYALDRPIHFREVLATMYQHLGIDPTTFLRDISNRPVPVLAGQHEPIREIIA